MVKSAFMGNISTLIAYLALVDSFLSALIALWQRQETKRSAAAAERQTAIAEDAAKDSKDSAAAAGEAARAATRSVELAEQELAARQRSDVRLKHWSGSRGLVVQNHGPAPASNVVAYRFDNRDVNTSFATIGGRGGSRDA